MTDSPPDLAEQMNFHQKGWLREMGGTFVKATADEVVVEWTIEDKHRQPYGIVHGGVHCGIIESVCSVGGALVAGPRGQHVVGADNHTSFLKAVRSGTLRATAKPITRGRKTQLWEARVEDEDGRLIATGRVRLICLDASEPIGGESVTVPRR